MILVPIVQLAVCLLILRWLLKQKPGERFSKKAVWRFLLFGALSAVVLIALSLASPIKKDAFFDLHPLLSGFLTALLTAALLEEVLKYILFRLAIRKNGEVLCWQDAILAAVIVAIGFTLLDICLTAAASCARLCRRTFCSRRSWAITTARRA